MYIFVQIFKVILLSDIYLDEGKLPFYKQGVPVKETYLMHEVFIEEVDNTGYSVHFNAYLTDMPMKKKDYTDVVEATEEETKYFKEMVQKHDELMRERKKRRRGMNAKP